MRKIVSDRRRWRAPVGPAAAALALALAVGSTATATVDVVPSNDGTTITITARAQSGPDGDHGITIRLGSVRTFVSQRRFGDPSIETSSSRCGRNFLANEVVCDLTPSSIVLDLGDGADDVSLESTGFTCLGGDPDGADRRRVAVRATLGVGFDRFTIGEGTGVRDRDCPAGARSDAPRLDTVTVDGQEGTDRFFGAPSAESAPRGAFWAGGTGSDQLVPGFGTDVFSGGPNRDTVSYLAITTPVIVTPGLGLGDGPVDDVPGTTGARAPIDDVGGDVEVVIGGQVNDELRGGGGADELLGGPGADTYLAGGGDDVVTDLDGVADRVDCGTGTDEARLDLRDVVVTVPRFVVVTSPRRSVPLRVAVPVPTCENVTRAAVDDGPPGRIVARALKLRAPAVRLACPRQAKVRCRGTLTLRDPARPTGRLAARRYLVPRGRTRTLGFTLGDNARRVLRARGMVVAETREKGVSRKGPRSARRYLRVVR